MFNPIDHANEYLSPVLPRPVAQMSKREVRQMFRELGIVHDGEDRWYLQGLRGSCERRGDDEVIIDLITGGLRRLHVHDDPGSADQMLFCAEVIRIFGARGLGF